MTNSDNILTSLAALARSRAKHGDTRLTLNPLPEAQEHFEPPDTSLPSDKQGLVLEPSEGDSFETRTLAARQGRMRINAFADGTRSTYFVGHEDVYPLFYARNAAAVRTRMDSTGYHMQFANIERRQATLLAPLGQFDAPIRGAYERLGLCSIPHADLCWTEADDDNFGVSPTDMSQMGSLAWNSLGLRRARRLLDLAEQIVTLAGSRVLLDQSSDRRDWLLKDGSLFQFDKRYLKSPELLQNVVSCVKTHPVAFFGVEGERLIAQLQIGERSVAFLPRPTREVQLPRPSTLETTVRPIVSWYLRVRPPNPLNPSLLSGIIRLDITATDDWRSWIDEVSWAVLDEFYGLSAMPDPRHDVMPYGIYDCERFLKAQQIPGELLLAQLA